MQQEIKAEKDSVRLDGYSLKRGKRGGVRGRKGKRRGERGRVRGRKEEVNERGREGAI